MQKRSSHTPPERLDRSYFLPLDEPQRRRRHPALWPVILLAFLAAGAVLVFSLRGAGAARPAQAEPQASALPQSQPADPSPQEPEAGPDEAAATVVADAPEAGASLMQLLQARYPALDLTVQPGLPYLLCVNRAAGVVNVFVDDGSGRYGLPYSAILCSGGEDTPLGVFNTPENYGWRALSGNVYGQYATRIWSAYLFHSVPYYTQHKDDLEYDQFNMLGTTASLGCIRLMVCDVKWIYDNCPIGTTVVIYDDAAAPGPLGKPEGIYIDPADETLRGWDPTDPDPANPWGDTYRDGVTLRTQAAWEDWQAYREGALLQNLNPTDLQGYSTDSSIVGTRG